MDPDKIMEGLSKELGASIKAMSKAKSVEERVAHSQVIKNLSSSLGVFLSLVNDMMGMDYDLDDEDHPF